MELEKYRRYSEMARGLRPAETVFRGAKVFMSRTGEFVDGDVAVADGVILGVGDYRGETEIDLTGKYLWFRRQPPSSGIHAGDARGTDPPGRPVRYDYFYRGSS